MIFTESYQSACVSTAHITEGDQLVLTEMANNGSNMIALRPSGYFIKLYDDASKNQYPALSDQLNRILRAATEQGYRLLEIDCDEIEVKGVEVYDY